MSSEVVVTNSFKLSGISFNSDMLVRRKSDCCVAPVIRAETAKFLSVTEEEDCRDCGELEDEDVAVT